MLLVPWLSLAYTPALVTRQHVAARQQPAARRCAAPRAQQISLEKLQLGDGEVEQLFAWLNMAFAGEAAYNDLMLGFTCIFADHAPGSAYARLLADAMARLPAEEERALRERVGEAVSLRQRERGSLGAMGAGQWTGQWRTRPHALLDVRGLASVEEWERSLPRGCRRTLAKALDQNFTVEAVGRYVGCTSQAGEIREYRDARGKVLAFAHEATKGRVMRGQWFYSTDQAAKNYVWFHSVRELVRRAIEAEGVDMVDLGPSGTDAFSQLKAKYGFASVDDWHAVADYRGPFRYAGGGPAGERWAESPISWAELDPPDWLFEDGLLAQVRKSAAGLSMP